MKFLAGFFMLCVFAGHPSYVYAHGEGKSYEKKIGNYLLDVGYTPEKIVAGESVYFDFRLYQERPVPGAAAYSDVWVRIFQGTTTFFASGLAPTTGQTGMVYTFDTPGVYTVSTRFERGAEVLGETSFSVEVEPVGRGIVVLVPYVAGVLCILLGLFFVYRRGRIVREDA